MRGVSATAVVLTSCRWCGKPLTGSQQYWCSHNCKQNGHRSGRIPSRPAAAVVTLPVTVALPVAVDNPDQWKLKSACRGVDPDLFFPDRGGSVREAKEVCRGCPVREECLRYALENGESFGIWGGTSERERRSLRSRRRYRLSA
jgi:WhiB family transcriptional regulator, redox-sensing transcriptional regulator